MSDRTLPRRGRTPKHRRRDDRPGWVRYRVDLANNAPCSGCSSTSGYLMVNTMCPRHDATAYSLHMARHATDSI